VPSQASSILSISSTDLRDLLFPYESSITLSRLVDILTCFNHLRSFTSARGLSISSINIDSRESKSLCSIIFLNLDIPSGRDSRPIRCVSIQCAIVSVINALLNPSTSDLKGLFLVSRRLSLSNRMVEGTSNFGSRRCILEQNDSRYIVMAVLPVPRRPTKKDIDNSGFDAADIAGVVTKTFLSRRRVSCSANDFPSDTL